MKEFRIKDIPDDAVVIQHRYRTAIARDTFLSIECDGETWHDEQEKFAKRAGTHCDNHVVYEIRYTNGHTLYVMFSDLRISYGFTIDLTRW